MKILTKKWCFPNRSGINLGWSLDLQDIKKHHFGWVPSYQTLKKTQKMINSKSQKNHQKLKHLTTFWTLFSQISHAGACVAWRRASRGTFTWLLEQILAQSNYRTCWIFGSTSVQILGSVSSRRETPPPPRATRGNTCASMVGIYVYIYIYIWRNTYTDGRHINTKKYVDRYGRHTET